MKYIFTEGVLIKPIKYLYNDCLHFYWIKLGYLLFDNFTESFIIYEYEIISSKVFQHYVQYCELICGLMM